MIGQETTSVTKPLVHGRSRVLLVSIVPPQNDCGVRIVMHRHLVERSPFDLHVATTYDSCNPDLAWTQLRLPYPLHRLRRTRFGPALRRWFADYENWILPLTSHRVLDDCVRTFKPDVILTLAETGLCHLAKRTARKHGIPLAGLFLDWFPIMEPHFGHGWAQSHLSRRYRQLYRQCDLAFCTSDGMQEVLGPHPNSHVIYPMPAKHHLVSQCWPPRNRKFRVVYVGSVRNHYGRMLSALVERLENESTIEIIVVGGNADWPAPILEKARTSGAYLGYLPPEKSSEVLLGADALLVVMSFEREHELFMRTSFTTKFLDYAAFHKPILLWAPDYCTPMRVVRREGGALPVNTASLDHVVEAIRSIASNSEMRVRLAAEARQLNAGTFNPDRLQDVFVSQIEALAHR